MKLLVLAQTPPPLHGQSLMVRTLVNGLPAQGIAIHHINLGLSRDTADIGRWRLGKLATVIDACLHTILARFTAGCDTLYYVPAPGKRGALYRDWLVMLLCRPFYPRLVLHWHAVGLGAWLATQATAPERWLTHRLLGQAALSIVLAESLRGDAQYLSARKIAVVPNGIADPGTLELLAPSPNSFQVLFLGLCSEAKGLFAAAEAVIKANRTTHVPFTLIAAGPFPDAATASRFEVLCQQHPGMLRHVGPVGEEEKSRLLRTSDCLCLPTTYAAEGQPLVLLEAMAHDLPIIATRWRAIPDTVPAAALLGEPGDTHAITSALLQLQRAPLAPGLFRQHYLANYTEETHLTALAHALSHS